MRSLRGRLVCGVRPSGRCSEAAPLPSAGGSGSWTGAIVGGISWGAAWIQVCCIAGLWRRRGCVDVGVVTSGRVVGPAGRRRIPATALVRRSDVTTGRSVGSCCRIPATVRASVAGRSAAPAASRRRNPATAAGDPDATSGQPSRRRFPATTDRPHAHPQDTVRHLDGQRGAYWRS
ncbi:hypothetical protein AORI_1654 [Amycolatopsis keratiniphila]|uniref:Uncharacterized protein n=1 Tax=Amycolatopsis keratiniphila TaxID=129921 RepID=R4SZP1_9PSEU|nr:hypothetical protein AORI_1654 [Amycolatopsis keratiniphila]